MLKHKIERRTEKIMGNYSKSCTREPKALLHALACLSACVNANEDMPTRNLMVNGASAAFTYSTVYLQTIVQMLLFVQAIKQA